MQKQTSPKITALVFFVLTITLLAAFYAIAWQDPISSPPDPNVDKPINVGTDPQAKQGRVSATEFYDYNDPSYYINPSGSSNIDTLCFGPADCRSSWPPSGGSSDLAIFGDGSDGDVTISSNTSLVRDTFYNNLTINSGFVLNPNGYRIFVRGTLTNNGTIARNGNNASGLTAGSALVGGSLAGGTAGGNGANPPVGYKGGGGGGGGGVVLIIAKVMVNNGTIQANGGNGANASGISEESGGADGGAGTNASAALGGAGGAGGYYLYGGLAGAGGTVSAPTAAQGGYRALPFAILLKDGTTKFMGGAGGGGGGGESEWGAAGGGGGGGGLIMIIYNTATWGTEQANAGTFGTAIGIDSTNGTAGSVGTIIKIVNQ